MKQNSFWNKQILTPIVELSTNVLSACLVKDIKQLPRDK